MAQEIIINDPKEMEIAKKASWLCKLFQKHNLEVADKQHIIRDLINLHKIKKEKENGQDD